MKKLKKRKREQMWKNEIYTFFYIQKFFQQTLSDIKTESEEIPVDSNDQEFNEDVLKQESEQVETETVSTKFRKFNKVTADIVAKLSEILKGDWEALAAKFRYQPHEVNIKEKQRKINKKILKHLIIIYPNL